MKKTLRPISTGAEKWLGKEVSVLDHGFVRLVDYMGNDEAIEQAARVSYGGGTRKLSETRGLIRYLMRHQHTSPFEMVEFKFHAKMPIFVARQWVRHRTASINEISGRYSVLDKEFYLPEAEVLAEQSGDNKQGRGIVLDKKSAKKIINLLKKDANLNYVHYENMLGEMNLARELARMDLTLNYYTQWFWKANLHNIFHFLKLRLDKHAQYEIRVYAEAMAKIIKDAVPLAYEAFEDYQKEGLSFSKLEMKVLKNCMEKGRSSFGLADVEMIMDKCELVNKRERIDFINKLKEEGIING